MLTQYYISRAQARMEVGELEDRLGLRVDIQEPQRELTLVEYLRF